MTDNFPNQTNQGNTFNVVGNLNVGEFSKNKAIRFLDLPTLDAVVYGREVEVSILTNFFVTNQRHCAVIAPSCFGKTFLIRKFLQNVNADDAVYKKSFDKIIYFNCREISSVGSVIDKFKVCLGEGLNEANFFAAIQSEKILCIFDNFESWLDNGEIISYIHKFFNIQNKLRIIFVSTTEPRDELFNNLQLKGISEGLSKGLDKDAAIKFVKAEGKNSSLDKVAENEPEKLLNFFDKEVSFNPQAIRSLIKFFEIKRDIQQKGFDEFVANFKEGFAEFENSKERFKDINDEFRPTLYLISLQIKAQDERSRDLLSVLAFFESEVPERVIEEFKPKVSAFEKEVIDSLLDNWLVEEITIRRGEGFRYYSPHLMIRRVVRDSLPKFEDKHHETFESLADELFDIARSNHVGKHNYEEAINLYRCVERLYEYLVNKTGRTELANDLAAAFMNKGNALDSLGKLNEAIAEYDKAIDLREEMLRDRYFHILPNIAIALGNRLDTHRKAGNADLAEKDMRRLHELLEFTKQHKEIEHLGKSIQTEIDKWS